MTSSTEPTNAKPARAAGRVVDAANGAGIEGARIVFTDTDLDAGASKRPGVLPTSLTVVTDEDGEWAIERVPIGTYFVSATAEGFLPGVSSEVELLAGAHANGLELRLKAGGELFMGTVADVGGGPIAGALINAVPLDGRSAFEIRRPVFGTATGDDGTFRLTLEVGTYVVIVEHADYVTKSRTVDVSYAKQRADFYLAPGGIIEGRVLARGSGQPVGGAFVTLEGGLGRSSATGISSSMAEAFSTLAVATNQDGSFRFTKVGSGSVELVARGRGHASVQPTDVDLGIAEHVSDVVVWVDPAQTVSGYVVTKEDGKPIEGAAVLMSELGSTVTNYAALKQTGEDGYFEIVGVPPGHYLASAVAAGHKTRLMDTTISVADADVGDVVIEVARGATLTGRVDPAASAKLSLSVDMSESTGFSNMFAAMEAVFVTAESSGDGRFVLRGVPHGDFEVVARTKDGRRGVLPVNVSGNGEDGLVIRLEDQGSLAGRVVDERNRPMVGYRVRVEQRDAPTNTLSMDNLFGGSRVWTDEKGHFEAVGLKAGKYQISVHDKRAPESPAGTDGMLPFARTEFPYLPEMHTLKPHEKVTGVVLTVRRSKGVISGTVIDQSGTPMGDAWVSARRISSEDANGVQDFGQERSVLSDGDGTFVLEGLREGNYTLTANHPSLRARAQAENVRTGQTATLRLSALGSIAGRVTHDGALVKSFKVQLTGPSWRDRPIRNDAGEFVLERLAAGSYEVYVTAESGGAFLSIEVKPGEVTAHELRLTGWGSVKGRVVSIETGEPLSGFPVLALLEHGNRYHDVFGNMATGLGPKTDADGRFVVDNLGHGKGMITVYNRGFTASDVIASTLFELQQGEHKDIGEIRALSSVPTVEKSKRGFLGLVVEPGIWRGRSVNQDGEMSTPSYDSKNRVLRVTCSLPSYSPCRPPATEAGIVPGDEILAINGLKIAEIGPQAAELMLRFGKVEVGQTFELRVRRGSNVFDVSVVAGPLPADIVDTMP